MTISNMILELANAAKLWEYNTIAQYSSIYVKPPIKFREILLKNVLENLCQKENDNIY